MGRVEGMGEGRESAKSMGWGIEYPQIPRLWPWSLDPRGLAPMQHVSMTARGRPPPTALGRGSGGKVCFFALVGSVVGGPGWVHWPSP